MSALPTVESVMAKQGIIARVPNCITCGLPSMPDYFGYIFQECYACVQTKAFDDLYKAVRAFK